MIGCPVLTVMPLSLKRVFTFFPPCLSGSVSLYCNKSKSKLEKDTSLEMKGTEHPTPQKFTHNQIQVFNFLIPCSNSGRNNITIIPEFYKRISLKCMM
jgi:hypothetical protein